MRCAATRIRVSIVSCSTARCTPSSNWAGVCVGIPFVEMLFCAEPLLLRSTLRAVDDEVLTYHVGMEIFRKRDPEYLSFNKAEFWKAIRVMLPHLDSRRFPWGHRNVCYRLVRWGLHPAIPIRLALMLEPRRWRPTVGRS